MELPVDNAQVQSTSTPAKARFGGPQFAKSGKVRLMQLDHLAGRTIASRRARDLREAILSDLGTDNPSEVRRLRRAQRLQSA